MLAFRRAALPALLSVALAGCAGLPTSQPLKPEVRRAVQPVELKVGVAQPELYAAFERSNAGTAAAAGCGAIPGIGVLLAAVCGGAAGAMDASINATRAKAADEAVRPLKDAIVDLNVDRLATDTFAASLKSMPDIAPGDVVLTKTVNDEAYEKLYRASSANSVMFVNFEYRLSVDFSQVEMFSRGLMFPRGADARTAAGQAAALPAEKTSPPVLALQNTAYRRDLVFRARLDSPGENIGQNIDAWKADDARLLRAALNTGITKLGRLLAEDLAPGAGTPPAAAIGKVRVDGGIEAELLSKTPEGELLRHPDGTLQFRATLNRPNAVAIGAAPTAAQ